MNYRIKTVKGRKDRMSLGKIYLYCMLTPKLIKISTGADIGCTKPMYVM